MSSMPTDPIIEPIKIGKAKGWLGEWHWVLPPVTDQNKYNNVTDDAIEWCKEHFGKSGSRWFEKEKKFFFKNEKDMTLFILRWS
jgi:hypothetical protein